MGCGGACGSESDPDRTRRIACEAGVLGSVAAVAADGGGAHTGGKTVRFTVDAEGRTETAEEMAGGTTGGLPSGGRA